MHDPIISQYMCLGEQLILGGEKCAIGHFKGQHLRHFNCTCKEIEELRCFCHA